MPSSKRRSSGRGSTPSKSPVLSPATLDGKAAASRARDHLPQTPASDSKGNARAGSTSNVWNSYDVGFNATVVAVDDREVKGKAFLWMSEDAMVTASIATGSLISVSVVAVGGGARSCSGSLESLHELCNAQNEAEISCSEAAGTYVAIGMAWPSRKLVRNEVKLSRVLGSALGSLPLGSTISLNPLKVCSSTANLVHFSSEFQDPTDPARLAILYDCVHVSLRWCPPSEAVLARGNTSAIQCFPSFCSKEVITSSPSHQTPKRLGHQESEIGLSLGQAVSASPISRLPLSESPGKRRTPLRGDKYEQGNVLEQRSKIRALQNWASFRASFEMGKENVKNLLETFAARWIAGCYLLPGNLVHIPLCGCDCIFLVTEIQTSAQILQETSDSSDKVISYTHNGSDLDKTKTVQPLSRASLSPPLEVYLVGHNTKITLLSPALKEEPDAEVRQPEVGSSVAGRGQQDIGLDADVDRIEYSALGGLSMQIDKLKQHVELSLLRPEYLTRYGLQPVRGVLLHGPPGTGKSSLARAAACEAGVKLFAINGPEIVSEFYGESEASIQAIFASATRAAPSVVFIDELDAIAPSRKEGGEELGQRMVATLLTLMDGGAKENLEGVLVIAASNRIDAIDQALRRPGRFDVEIEIGVPSPADRQDILHVLLQDMQHALMPPDVAGLAATTHGFVGADLSALCNEAAMSALRKSVHLQNTKFPVAVLAQNFADLLINSEPSEFSRKPMQGLPVHGQSVGHTRTFEGHTSPLEVTVEDFQAAMTKVRPSAMREVALEVPKVRWSDIGGQDDVKQKLREIVEWPQKQHDAIARVGIEPPHGVLLHGPPGCSKTLMARAVASETGLNFIAVKGPELFSKWVGESEKAVQTLFSRARAAAPSVVFFDEIDGLAVKRESGHGEGVSVSDRVMSQLLTEMDGLIPMKGVSVIAATNRLDIIDDALLRPGRFDRVLYVGPPDKFAREQIFGIHLRQMPCGPDVCQSTLASQTVNYTGADIYAVCQEAAMAALTEDLEAKLVGMCHFDIALARVQPSGNQ